MVVSTYERDKWAKKYEQQNLKMCMQASSWLFKTSIKRADSAARKRIEKRFLITCQRKA